MLNASSAYDTVPGNDNITLIIDVDADPAPTVTWQLDGEDLPSMANTSLK